MAAEAGEGAVLLLQTLVKFVELLREILSELRSAGAVASGARDFRWRVSAFGEVGEYRWRYREALDGDGMRLARIENDLHVVMGDGFFEGGEGGLVDPPSRHGKYQDKGGDSRQDEGRGFHLLELWKHLIF